MSHWQVAEISCSIKITKMELKNKAIAHAKT